jgi:hypothetical protein
MVTPTVPITTTMALESILTLHSIPTITVWTAAPQPGMELLPVQQQAYQEEQQERTHTRQINSELWVAQHHDKLIGEQLALNAQLTGLHRCNATMGIEQAATIDFVKARARARDVTTAINHEGTLRPTFARAS